jgi:hypothetical protein
VLGTAYGYEVESIWVFVESLRRHYTDEVKLLVSSKSSPAFFDYLASRQITPVFFDSAAWMISHLLFSRLVRYAEVLRGSDVCYDRILLTDVNDVVFQGHPFEHAPEGDLLCFMEAAGRKIADCRTNRNWIADLFEAEVLARVADKEISCAGTTLGSHAAVLEYLDLLIGSVTTAQLLSLEGRGGHEQGIHNVLLHTGGLSRAQRVANGVHVFTLGYVLEKEYRLDHGDIVVEATGVKCPIIHQYNYKTILQAQILSHYPLPGASPQLRPV